MARKLSKKAKKEAAQDYLVLIAAQLNAALNKSRRNRHKEHGRMLDDLTKKYARVYR